MLHPLTFDVAPDTGVVLHRRRVLLVLRLTPGPHGLPRRTESLDVIRERLLKAGLRQVGDTTTAARPVLTHRVRQTSPPTRHAAVNHSEGFLWVEDVIGRDIDPPRIDALVTVMGNTLDDVAPVYQSAPHVAPVGQAAFLPRVLLIEPRGGATAGKLDEVIAASGGRVDKERSRYLGRFRYVTLDRNSRHTAFTLRALLLDHYASLVGRVCHEQIPLESPLAFLPDDEHYGQQWNMEQIHAPRAWDVTRGAGVTVAVIDSGTERAHPDLNVSAGINLETMVRNGAPVHTDSGRRNRHGTQVAGVIAARINNGIGVAGLAGDAVILPIATATYSDAAVAMGITFAAAEGARVVNMSFRTQFLGFWTGPIPDAIDDAVRAGCVLCAATGNADARGLFVPALHPQVMAVGGSGRTGERWRLRDGTGVVVGGSNYGDQTVEGHLTGVSVVAPADVLATTDLVGSDATSPPGSPFHGYDLNFDKTSAATAHVSAVAALVMTRFPDLSPADVRRVIEQTAEKVGAIPYAYVDGFFNGTRNEEMGYGRVHAFHALRMADLFIRDWPGDTGLEPSTPPDGNFFSRSDIVLRPSDSDAFEPDSLAASLLEPGRDHVVAVRVTNRGPSIAHNVQAEVRVTPFVGLEFHYPDDWTAEDELHLRPEASSGAVILDAGEDAIATFTLNAADVDRAAGWEEVRWHPCVLAGVTNLADNAFDPDRVDTRGVVRRFNNLAQRNLSVLRTTSESIEWMPFAIGHPRNTDGTVEVMVDADARLGGSMRLWVAGSGVRLPAAAKTRQFQGGESKVIKVGGGKVGTQGAKHWVDIKDPKAHLMIARTPGRRQFLVLETRIPRGVAPGQRLTVHLRQLRRGLTLGGATVTYVT
jgi:hypothetical protein